MGGNNFPSSVDFFSGDNSGLCSSGCDDQYGMNPTSYRASLNSPTPSGSPGNQVNDGNNKRIASRSSSFITTTAPITAVISRQQQQQKQQQYQLTNRGIPSPSLSDSSSLTNPPHLSFPNLPQSSASSTTSFLNKPNAQYQMYPSAAAPPCLPLPAQSLPPNPHHHHYPTHPRQHLLREALPDCQVRTFFVIGQLFYDNYYRLPDTRRRYQRCCLLILK